MLIRPERAGDEQSIARVVEAAFDQRAEAELVGALRRGLTGPPRFLLYWPAYAWG